MSQPTNNISGTIVVIEDNHLNLKLVSALLTSGRYRFFSAMDAEKGLALIREHRPDLVLMDIQLPGMDGLTATRKIMADPEIRHIPVVALSAHAMTIDQREAVSIGMVGYITKPFCTRTFLEKIDGYMASGHPLAAASSERIVHQNRVLVVDDETLILKLIEAKLANEGYEITCLTAGKEVLQTAAESLPDIILLDVIMPDMNGFEVVRQLKADPATENIPVVLITSLDNAKDKARGLEAGADDFLNKPLNTEELKARVRSLLRMKRYKEQLDGRDASARYVYTESGEPGPEKAAPHTPTILIAEDDEISAKLFKSFLREVPGRVIHTTTGESALRKIEAEKPDLVLLDLVLPDLDGWTICRKIKEDDRFRHTQVVIVTSLNDLDSRIRGIKAGTDDYLIKPIQADELLARVTALLKKKAYLDSLASKMDLAVQSSISDDLTGLYAHGYLKHYLDLEIKRAQRYHHLLAFIMLDVDNFKQFNDTHGHLAGDSVLKATARLLKETIRTTDLAARYGGEEFALVLPYTDKNGAVDLAGRIKTAIGQHNRRTEKKEERFPTVSMGIAVYPASGIQTIEQLIEAADKALYTTKREGKNGFTVALGAGPDHAGLRVIH